EQSSNVSGVTSVLTGNEVCHLRELIYDNKNRIPTTPRHRQPSDKIYGKIFPRGSRNRQRRVETMRTRPGLSLMACHTTLTILRNTVGHLRPEEVLAKCCQRFRHAKVSTTMCFLNQQISDRG